MRDELIACAILVAVISMLFSIQNALQSYIAAGIVIVVLLSTVLFLKTRQPIPETRGAFNESCC